MAAPRLSFRGEVGGQRLPFQQLEGFWGHFLFLFFCFDYSIAGDEPPNEVQRGDFDAIFWSICSEFEDQQQQVLKVKRLDKLVWNSFGASPNSFLCIVVPITGLPGERGIYIFILTIRERMAIQLRYEQDQHLREGLEELQKNTAISGQTTKPRMIGLRSWKSKWSQSSMTARLPRMTR